MVLNTDNEKWYTDVYTERYKEFGYSPKTLGWVKGKQNYRFDVLTSQADLRGKHILDIGCGFGDLNKCLEVKFKEYSYYGIDIVPILITEAREKYKSSENINIEFECGDFLKKQYSRKFNYALASGIFNYKLENQDNYEYVEAVLAKALELCDEGIAFDFLSDTADQRHPHNFYFNPGKVLSIAYKYTRNIVMRSDYMPFEFAIFLFKDDSFEVSNTMFKRYLKK